MAATETTYKSLTHLFVTSLILGVVILATVVGNVFVLLAIVLERNLHSVANYLIASLAVADLMVAALVMPLAAVNEVSTRWFLGREACDAWTSFDVLCCTASILHLVSISLDRYWAVSRVDYIRNRSATRILVMIAASWGISAVISIPPLFGQRGTTQTLPDDDDSVWNNETSTSAPSVNITTVGVTWPTNEFNDCLISQDWGYTVFSTIGAFYIPLLFMIVVYARIYQLVRARIHKKHFAKKAAAAAASRKTAATTAAVDGGGGGPIPIVDGGLGLQTSALVTDTPSSSNCRTTTTIQADLTTATRCASDYGDDDTATRPDDDDDDDGRHAATTPTTLTVLLQTPPDSPPKPEVIATSSPTAAAEKETPVHRTNGNNDITVCPPASSNCRGSWLDLTRLSPPLAISSSKPVELTAREKRERARERKAARTLAIITGSFIICWLPFFLIALVRPFCGDNCHFPDLLVSIITWLGYISSLLNPIIYNVFNPDFRSASSKILFGKYRKRH